MTIKNFKSKKVKPDKLVTKPILVADYMITKVITFTPDQTMLSVMDTLVRKKISGGPVVNDKNELVGIISERDCLRKIANNRYFNVPLGSAKVEQFMIKEVETISQNTNIFDAVNLFLKKRKRRFPVIHNGKLVGQVSQREILKAALTINSKQTENKFSFNLF